jgi:hypothetical protein
MQAVLKKRQSEGLPTPLDDQPVPMHEVRHVWTCFTDLCSRRSFSGFGGPMAIPTSEILAWCSMFGIDAIEDRRELYDLVGELDDEWLKWHKKTARTAKPSEEPKRGRNH